jgi:putative AdoMet-dependent methyltransferase
MKSTYPVESFDKIADSYDSDVATAQGFPHDGYKEVLSQVVQRADTQPGMHILDLGVGTGNLAVRFISAGCKVWGIDFSAKMLDKARQKLKNAVLIQSDLLEEWPAEIQQCFDRVVSTYTLHHFDLNTKLELLSRISRRFLIQDGLIVIGDISFPMVRDREKARRILGDDWEVDEFYWAGDETIDIFTEAGFRTEYMQVSSCGGVYVIKKF